MGRLLWRPAGPGAAAARPEGDCTVCMYVEPIEVYAWRVHDVHVFACETNARPRAFVNVNLSMTGRLPYRSKRA